MATRHSDKLATNIQRKLLSLTLVAIGALIFVQIIILSNVGTVGPRLSKTRNQIDQLQLDNELKSAEIRELQTNNQILVTAYSELGMQPNGLKLIGRDANLNTNAIAFDK